VFRVKRRARETERRGVASDRTHPPPRRDRSENTLWRVQNGEFPPGLAVRVVVILTGPMDFTHLPRLTATEQADQVIHIPRLKLPQTPASICRKRSTHSLARTAPLLPVAARRESGECGIED